MRIFRKVGPTKLHNLRCVFAKFGGVNFPSRVENATMQALLSAPSPVRLLPQTSKSLKVVVAYDGIEAGRQAMKVYSHLIHEIAIDLQCENTLVSFNLLANPVFAGEAEETASEADMLIVAASEALSLPPAVRRWIEKWLITRLPGDGALVGITRTRPDESSPERPLHDYLANVAEQSGIPYFRGVFPAFSEPVLRVPGLQDNAQSMTPRLDGKQRHPSEYLRWGINE
jgi:hypothetical protein